MSKIVLEDFNEGNGYYKVNLAYLNKEQVEEIENLVEKWNPTDEVEPTPLTPEILEKNGFIYTTHHLCTLSEDKVWQIENTDMQVLIELEVQTDENLIEYYVGNFLCGPNSCTLYFRYVHQLQYALRLCGIKKEIIL